MSLIYSYDFRPKLKREAYLLVHQQNSEQGKRSVGYHNLNLIPNQLKENVITTKASLKYFALNYL